MITIAVTGGMGSGKTETIQIIQALGAATISADELGHAVYATGSDAFYELKHAFGQQIIASDGSINRQRLGAMIFASQEKRKLLESIVWPRIKTLLEENLQRNREACETVSAFEAAVLFEARWNDIADTIWTVEAPYDQRLKRIIAKTGMEEHAIRQRIEAQLTPEYRIKHSDKVICNNGDLNQLRHKVTELWNTTI